MRFRLLRRFSHLIHRRTRSDPTELLHFHHADTEQTHRPYSLDGLSGRVTSPAILQEMLASSLYVQNSEHSRTPDISSEVAAINRRISEIERDSFRLKEDIGALAFHAELQETNIRDLDPMIVMEEQIQIARLSAQEQDVLHCEYIVQSLASHGLGMMISGISAAISKGSGFEDALVESLREAASHHGSPWAKLIPPVVGTRTSDQYESAVSSLSAAQRELKRNEKRYSFWKMKARQDESNSNLITPSTSNISDVQVSVPEKRQAAANQLLASLRGGDIPLRSQVVCHPSPAIQSFAMSISDNPPPKLPVDPSNLNANEHMSIPVEHSPGSLSQTPNILNMLSSSDSFAEKLTLTFETPIRSPYLSPQGTGNKTLVSSMGSTVRPSRLPMLRRLSVNTRVTPLAPKPQHTTIPLRIKKKVPARLNARKENIPPVISQVRHSRQVV